MANRDFIDDDLVQPLDDLAHVKLGPGDIPSRSRGPLPEGTGRSQVSELDLPLMTRQRKAIDEQTAQQAEELERLRQRQKEIEREKLELEDIRRRQADYATGKKELVDRLHQSLVSLERQEVRLAQTIDTVQSCRVQFKDMLQRIDDIDEETWQEDTFRDDLNKALALIEEARMEYNKSTARIESALGGDREAGDKPSVFFDHPSHAEEPERGFWDWVLVGLAVSLPLIVVLVVLAIFFLLNSIGML